MARKLELQSNVTAPNGTYPRGQIRNDDGSGNGTPVTENLYGDLHQFTAKLMADAGITPNNLPDNETNGYQLNQALKKSTLGGSWFSSVSSQTTEVGKWVRMYNITLTSPSESSLFEFDVSNWGSIAANSRSAKFRIHIKLKNLTTPTLESQTITKLNGEDFADDDLRMVLIASDPTRIQFGVYVKFKYNYCQLTAITRLYRGGTIEERPLETPVVDFGASLQYYVKKTWSEGNEVVDSIAQTFTGTIDVDEITATKKGGLTFINGRLFIPAVDAMIVGSDERVTLTMQDEFFVNTSDLPGNRTLVLGAVSMDSAGLLKGSGSVKSGSNNPNTIEVEFRVSTAVINGDAMVVEFSGTYPSI